MMYDYHMELESVSSGRSRDEEEEEQSADLLGMLRLPRPLISCCDTLCFSLLTLLLLVEVLSAVAVLTVYALHAHWLWLALSGGVFVLTALLTSLVYAAHVRHTHGVLLLLAFFLLNVPAQIAILGHQMRMTSRRCASTCCCLTNPQAQDLSSRKQKLDSNLWWLFIKLDLIHAVLNCTPQMVLTILYMFWYDELHLLQYIYLASSFALLVLSSVMHEKLRKERARNSPYGCLPMICILLYRSFVFAARIIAFAIFYLYFGLLILAVILPHFITMTVFFTYLYRQVWKVPYFKIVINSVYCILAYFPIHCEYRPEGEIVLYYIIYLLENIVMVGLAFAQEPFMAYTKEMAPWSDFHKTSTALVLLFSSIGLMFMGTYYFFFHGANETISDTSLGWLAKVFEWTKRTSKATHRVGFYSVSASTQSSFSNPLYLENPPLIAQPQQPIRENVTSPLWGEPPHHPSLYRPPNDRITDRMTDRTTDRTDRMTGGVGSNNQHKTPTMVTTNGTVVSTNGINGQYERNQRSVRTELTVSANGNNCAMATTRTDGQF